MNTAKNGIALALAAAALLSAGCAAQQSAATQAKIHCAGINSCKGTGACKTAENACKGQNACKGHGYVEATETECKEKGGKVI